MLVFFDCVSFYIFFYFFFNDTATTEIYTLSLHDALPISPGMGIPAALSSRLVIALSIASALASTPEPDRKSTRLNSSHDQISYAVFCLKKKKKTQKINLKTKKKKKKHTL